MATPTPMKHVLSQQGRTPAGATPPVSTPFSTHAHAAFSPLGPRSSPQQIKRSPGNSATLMGHSISNRGGGGGGMPGSGGGMPVGYDSPAAAAMGALGLVDLGGLDHVSVSGLGSLVALGRTDEDERARRLQAVVDLLKTSPGRVSEAGLERLATAMGLECLWEEGMGGSKTRTLIIAGQALALEIAVANNLVTAVSVTFPESRAIVLRHLDRANRVLLQDLRLRPDESPLTKTLDAFAVNLERLAVLDRLSVEPGLNLYEAVAGIYETLDALYRWDLRRLRGAAEEEDDDVDDNVDNTDDNTDSDDDNDDALTVQCTRHGRPRMHAHGHLGLSLDYWRELRHVRPTQPGTRAYAADHERTWSILVGCAPMAGGLVYQPVRVSDKWLAEAVVVTSDDDHLLTQDERKNGGSGSSEPALDWLEPENTILPAPSPAQADGSGTKNDGENPLAAAAAAAGGGGGGGARLPDVHFRAVFDPPVTVPFSVWHHLCELVGLVPESDVAATFDALTFPAPPGRPHDPSEPRTITRTMDVLVPPQQGGSGGGGGNRTQSPPAPDAWTAQKHEHTLFIYKPVYGRVLTELPFAHPRQLVSMLPVLRQYAFLATLLEKGFSTPMVDLLPPPSSPPTAATNPPGPAATTTDVTTTTTLEDAFAAFVHGDQQQQPQHHHHHRAKHSPRNSPRRVAHGAVAAAAAAGLAAPSFTVGRRSSDFAGTDADAHADADDDDGVTRVDVVLTTHPVPRLQVVFPFGARTADVVVEIGPNAAVTVVAQNVVADVEQEEADEIEEVKQEGEATTTTGDNEVSTSTSTDRGRRRRLRPQDLGRMLEVCEDLGVWCEWIRSRC